MGGRGFASGGGKYSGGRHKIGKKIGNAPSSNKAQNKQFEDACKAAEKAAGKELTPKQKDALHHEVSKMGYDFHEIVGEALEMLK